MRERHFLVLVLLVSLAIKIPLALLTTSFGVDESLYLSTAREFVENGDFGIKTEYYDFKFISPMFPFLSSLFYFVGGINAVLLISPIFSSLTVLVFYFLGKKIVSEKVGRIAAIIGLTNPALLVLASRPLTESVGIFFFSFSVLAMFLMLKDKKHKIFLLLFPILSILTLLSRFQYGGLLLVFFVLYVIISGSYRKLSDFRFIAGIILSILVALPWIIFNFNTYGSFIGGPAHQASTDLGFNISASYLYLPYLLVIVGAAVPFFFYGIYKNWVNKDRFLISMLLIVFLTQFFLFGKVAEERYLVPILPSVVVVGALGFYLIHKRFKRTAVYSFAVLMALNLLIGIIGTNLYHESSRYNDTKDAALFLKDSCGSPVMSNSFTHVWYYSGYENIPLRQSANESIRLAVDEGVDCILVSRYETPFNDIFIGSSEVTKIFDNDMVAVYRIL